ncbi:MAG: LysR family transcriptional regulator, partial [Chloroflexi bacterium]
MRGENVQLHERAFVEQHLDPIARRRFARRSAFVGGLCLGVQRLVATLAVLVDLLLRYRRLLALRRFDSFKARGGSPNRRQRARFHRAVTLRQLRTFTTVADLNSFSLAARRLKLSQPSVSYQVKELEETLGLPLLDRLGKRVQLTEAGTLLYGYARRMLGVLDEATVAIEEMRGIKRGTLRVGASTTVGIYLLPAALGAFKKLHPGLVISLEIGTRARVQEQVLRNELDLAVVGPALQDPELAIMPFLSDELVVIAPAGHPLTGKRGLSLKDLET